MSVELLERLGVFGAEAEAIVRGVPDRSWRRWVLDRVAGLVTAGMGTPLDVAWRWWPLWPRWPSLWGPVFLLATPRIRAWHRARGVEDPVSWATLRDYSRHYASDPGWLVHHYRGQLFQLGRLQFVRGRRAYGPIEPVLEIHIPAGGPLSPDEVDEAFRRAVEFFPRVFPEDASRHGVAQSWLLDPQLAEYLPETSNIVAFQRRFHLLPGWSRRGDGEILRATAGTDTTLRRAVVAHIESGRHWAVRRGWCELSAP